MFSVECLEFDNEMQTLWAGAARRTVRAVPYGYAPTGVPPVQVPAVWCQGQAEVATAPNGGTTC